MVSTLERPLFRNNSSPAATSGIGCFSDDNSNGEQNGNSRFFGWFKPRRSTATIFNHQRQLRSLSSSIYETDTMTSSLRRQWAANNNKRSSPHPQRSHSIQKEEPRYRTSTSSWRAFIRAILCASFHFLAILVVLSLAALVFAHIEEPDFSMRSSVISSAPTRNNSKTFPAQKLSQQDLLESATNDTQTLSSAWASLEKKYNVTFSTEDHDSIVSHIVGQPKVNTDKNNDEGMQQSAKPTESRSDTFTYNFKKWFYFASVVSTTIGYGDIAPKTQEGRVIYIIFSIISLPIMLSFIASCGDKFRKLHTNFLSVFRTYVKGQQGGTPEHLLTFLLIVISFIGHVSIGCALFPRAPSAKWTLVDKLYYHVATFTTVGLGDVIEPLDRQIENAVPMFFYRIVGLVLLYGALKAFFCWYQTQQEALAVLKLTQRPLKARGRISAILPCCCCRPKLKDEPKVESTMLI